MVSFIFVLFKSAFELPNKVDVRKEKIIEQLISKSKKEKNE